MHWIVYTLGLAATWMSGYYFPALRDDWRTWRAARKRLRELEDRSSK